MRKAFQHQTLAIRPDFILADDPVGTKAFGEYIHPQVVRMGSVAYLPICGVIVKGAPEMDQFFDGDCALNLVDEQLRNIAGDPSITDVVFDINSPGGVARGVAQTAQLISEIRASGKKVYSYTDGEMCSAAYWLASAGDFIFAERSATIGSISAMAAGIDSSEQWKKNGMELKLYRTGELKGAGMPGKPWTPAEEAAMAARVDVVDREFKSFVKSRRPRLSAEAMNGNYWYASDAPAGLHDGIMDHVGILLEYLAPSAGI